MRPINVYIYDNIKKLFVEALHQLGIENRVVKQADTFKLNLNTRQGNNLAFNMDFTKDIYSKTFKIGATFPETIPKTFAEGFFVNLHPSQYYMLILENHH